jgi:glycosyltransferase involved in cell wall biosynthesis
MTKQKLMYIAPHISTGGMPQYLLEQIQTFNSDYELYVIEYNNLSDEYVVQRNQIKEIIPPERYFCLGQDKEEILNILIKVRPDIVHFHDVPSWFIDVKIVDELLNLPNRPYYIVTPHSKYALPSSCKLIPDKYVLVSKWSYELYTKNTDAPCDLWEYPIKDLTPEKDKYKKELGLEEDCHHVLNVGLFTPGKNQGEVFEVAKLFNKKRVKFHFVGNQAINFKEYWGPLMENKPDNCVIWGERNDVHKFLQACDVFYFSSNLELFPLVVRESLSYKLPTLIKKLDTYLDVYDNNELIHYIGDDVVENKNKLSKLLKNDL